MNFDQALKSRPSLFSLVRQLDANLALVASGNSSAFNMVAITLDQLEARGVRMS